MLSFLKKLFGIGSSPSSLQTDIDFKKMFDEGAVIIDVRTVKEFDAGHIDGALNFPVQTIEQHIEEIRALNKPVIAHCRSGARSGRATKILNHHGIKTVNGGAFKVLKEILK